MNFPHIDFGWLGNGNLIGMTAVLHVIINHAIAIGGSVLMVALEYKGYKTNNEVITNYARWLSKWILIITTTVGAMTGVGIWFTTMVILPDAIGSLLRIFHWAWFVEWLVFVSEVVLLLVYFYTWDKWKGEKRINHIKIGIALCVMSWFTLVIITGILAAQINPGNWIETLSFWDAFFNPTWIPSMIFRTFAAITLGVAILQTFIRIQIKGMRDRIEVQNTYGKWLLLSAPIMTISGYWYLQTLPDKAQTLVKWATGMSDSVFILINFAGILFIFVLAIVLMDARPKIPLILTILVGLFSTYSLAEFEIIRENIRKPYVIYNYMYSNGILKSDEELINKQGALKTAKFAENKEITLENKLKAGEELFHMQCIACHTIDGPRRSRAMTNRLDGWTEDALIKFIPNMHNVREVMPPFVGTEEEVKAISAYLIQMVKEKEVTN